VDAQRLLLHPVRLRIVNTVLDGRDFTTADLGRRLPDVSRATVYRHLALLVAGGLVHLTHEERVRGGIRRTYRLTGRRPLLTGDDVAQLAPDEHRALMSNLATTMLAELSRYLAQPGARPAATSYRQFALWLTEKERDQLDLDLTAVVDRYARNTPGDRRRSHLLTAALFPTSTGTTASSDR
jgi:DNA-binding transcriptional ArsR family regulator